MVFGDLLKINNMYQFSLSSFVKLFNRALETKPQAATIQEKLKKLSNSLVKLCYAEVGRSLFKADRLSYSLYFIKGVFPQMFGPNEWEFFTGQAIASDQSSVPLPRWASSDRKDIFAMFANTFGMLVNSIGLDNDQVWGPFAQSETAEQEFPQQIASKVTPFQKLIIVQEFRPDRLESAQGLFVKEAFGG